MKMLRICLYPHPSSKNHGCEAIAVATAKIFSESFIAKKTLLTKYEMSDSRFGDDLVCSMYDNIICCAMPHIKRWTKQWFFLQVKRIFGNASIIKWLSERFINDNEELLENNDLFVSIGGDNYCYGHPTSLYAVHNAVVRKKKKSVLWGCSIEPKAIDAEMVDDLRLYDCIIARESITFQALLEHGLTNVCLYPDPAFTLETIESSQKFPSNSIGINLSPLIMNYAADTETIRLAFKKMIDYILQNTDMNVILIPHVTASTTDDRTELEYLINSVNCPERVFWAEDQNCCRIKDIISQCRFFVGARTHATIAAYSSCVPTVVCGYSVKAKGIAKDIFGSHEHYVIPVDTISRDDELIAVFQWLWQNEKAIREHLKQVIPDFIARAGQAGREIADVLSR